MDIIAEILAFASIGVVLAGVIEICRQWLNECRNWRRCAGRSAFWPLIH
jgi:hypothetical protein